MNFTCTWLFNVLLTYIKGLKIDQRTSLKLENVKDFFTLTSPPEQ